MVFASPAANKLSSGSRNGLVDEIPLIGWLTNGGPTHPKHQGWLHPVVACIVHYFVYFLLIPPAHDFIVDYYYQHDLSAREARPVCAVDLHRTQNLTAVFLFAYSVVLLVSRLAKEPPGEWALLYEYGWQCTISLPMGGWALLTNRPLLVVGLVIVVFTDQMLWYVDLVGYFLTGRFPVGVANYLTWPEHRK